MEDELHIWTLITRKLSGEATDAELEQLEALLKAQPEWQFSYEMLGAWWKQHPSEAAGGKAEESFSHLKDKLGLYEMPEQPEDHASVDTEYPWKSSHAKKGNNWLVASLLCAALVCVAWFIFYPKPNANKIQNGHNNSQGLSEVSTRYGSKSKATLPDGTVVWLNSGSKLTYNNSDFGDKKREVTLTGEGFFDVAFDAAHPFIIHAGKINIRVLGTAFDVKSYPEDNTSEATLIRGAIEVSFTGSPGKKVLLKPQQKLIVYKDDRIISQNLNAKQDADVKEYKVAPMTFIPSDSTVVETSWVQNKLAFRSETFADLAKQMERWYNVKINFSGSKIKHYRFTGIFMNESLEEALQALQITAPFHYRIEQNEVFIYQP